MSALPKTEDEFGLPTEDAAEMATARGKVLQLFLGWLKSAVDARLLSGIEDEWQLAEDLYAGVEPDMGMSTGNDASPQALKKPMQGKSRVIINIAEGKTNIAASQIIRRVLPGDVKPWEIGPTPVPEFDEAINGGSQEPVQLADGSTAPAADVAKVATKQLRDKSERMSKQIEDWLKDTAVYRGKSAYAELRKMIKDGARTGTGVVKGPVPTSVEEKRWSMQGNIATISAGKKLKPRALTISVRNCFPDPSCGDDIHNGAFFVERDYLTPRQVRELKDQPGYEAEALATVLKEGPQSFSRWDDRYKDERPGQTRIHDRQTFETFYLYADVSVRELVSCGYQIPALTMAPDGMEGPEAELAIAGQIEQALDLDSVPVVATLINGRIVKVILNPNEKGGFPYRFFRWAPVDGRPYGKGVPVQIATPQLMLTSSVRALMENGGQSAGPIVCMAKGVVTPLTGPYTLSRNKMYEFEPSEVMDDVRKAFGLFIVPSVAEQLFMIIKASQEWADQLANIPLLMQGITGATPDTLGGMEMLEANAASPLLDIAKEYDEVLAPLISDFYDWAMQDPNVSNDCKGDFQCAAIGASVLIHRDRKALALQQVVAPMAGNPAFGLSPERVGEQVVRALEIDPEDVKLTEDEKQAAAQQEPPQDPRIQAAQIKAQSEAEREKSRRESEDQERQFKAAMAQQDAVWNKALKDVDLQIQVMESARDRNLSVEQIRATLAEAAMKIKDSRERFAAEMNFAMTTGKGRGL